LLFLQHDVLTHAYEHAVAKPAVATAGAPDDDACLQCLLVAGGGATIHVTPLAAAVATFEAPPAANRAAALPADPAAWYRSRAPPPLP
jgi:hypothetical protein